MTRYRDLTLINIAAVVLAVAIYFLLNEKPEIPLAIIAAGISISFGVRQYQIENDKMFKDLFETFNARYDQDFNNLLNDVIENRTHESITKEEKLKIVDYLNFCAEEYLWYQKGRIDEMVWTSWENGIKYYLDKSPIKEIVDEQKIQKNSYYGLFEKLKL
jgi:hypothetical protein